VKTVNCFLYNKILQPWTEYFSVITTYGKRDCRNSWRYASLAVNRGAIKRGFTVVVYINNCSYKRQGILFKNKQSRQIDIAVKTVNCFLYNKILQPWTEYFSFWIKLNKCVYIYLPWLLVYLPWLTGTSKITEMWHYWLALSSRFK
jgi:hypothetical protein